MPGSQHQLDLLAAAQQHSSTASDKHLPSASTCHNSIPTAPLRGRADPETLPRHPRPPPREQCLHSDTPPGLRPRPRMQLHLSWFPGVPLKSREPRLGGRCAVLGTIKR